MCDQAVEQARGGGGAWGRSAPSVGGTVIISFPPAPAPLPGSSCQLELEVYKALVQSRLLLPPLLSCLLQDGLPFCRGDSLHSSVLELVLRARLFLGVNEHGPAKGGSTGLAKGQAGQIGATPGEALA